MNPSRAEVDARIGETFLALNQIAAALALIERSCDRVLTGFPSMMTLPWTSRSRFARRDLTPM